MDTIKFGRTGLEVSRTNPEKRRDDLCVWPLQSEPAAGRPGQVAPYPGSIERLQEIFTDVSPVLARSAVLARQACFRPITTDGLPLIGQIKGVKGADVATGHSVWGILNAPATGDSMAGLILDGEATTVDLAVFDPARWRLLPTAV
jgi:glycine/D-amino acid oxidase-like deaminating enzyme